MKNWRSDLVKVIVILALAVVLVFEITGQSYAQNTQAAAASQLDSAVRRALANNDIPHAKRLALTADHWKWIAEAQSAPASYSGGRTYGDTRVEMTNTQACKDAQRSYMLEAGAINPNPASVRQKQYAVGISCGR